MAERLEALRQSLLEYFGALNEVKAKIRSTVPEKPEALINYEQVQALGIPMVSGGVMDQPYIFLQEYAVCNQIVELFRALEERELENKLREGQGR